MLEGMKGDRNVAGKSAFKGLFLNGLFNYTPQE